MLLKQCNIYVYMIALYIWNNDKNPFSSYTSKSNDYLQYMILDSLRTDRWNMTGITLRMLKFGWNDDEKTRTTHTLNTT